MKKSIAWSALKKLWRENTPAKALNKKWRLTKISLTFSQSVGGL